MKGVVKEETQQFLSLAIHIAQKINSNLKKKKIAAIIWG